MLQIFLILFQMKGLMLINWGLSFISQHVDAEQQPYSTKVKSSLWKGHSKASECKYVLFCFFSLPGLQQPTVQLAACKLALPHTGSKVCYSSTPPLKAFIVMLHVCVCQSFSSVTFKPIISWCQFHFALHWGGYFACPVVHIIIATVNA